MERIIDSNKRRIQCQDSLQDFTFGGGGELKDFGGSSLGPLGVKNKVSKNFRGE